MKGVLGALYRLALICFPTSFRRAYGRSMTETFESKLERQGAGSVLNELIDVTSSGLQMRWDERKPLTFAVPRLVPELWIKDARHAVRALVRSPGFTLVAVASLALGIGANSAIFTAVNGFLLAPMPVADPASLVAVYGTEAGRRFPSNFSYPNYRDVAEETSVFAALVGFQGAPVSLNADGEPELVWSELVTDNYFEGLGVSSATGRVFTRADEGEPLVVVSHAYWRSRFDADPGVVGKTVELNGWPFTVAGVAGEGFTGAKMLAYAPDLWVPLSWHEWIRPGDDERLERRTGSWLNVRGRLADGVTLEQAEAALETISVRLEQAHRDANEGLRLHVLAAPRKVEPFVDVMTGGALPAAAGALLGIVGIVLLIACANVASLTFARALAREKEMALRVSLGASRARVLRQLFFESLALCIAAGVAGYWLGGRILDGATRFIPNFDFQIDFGLSPDSHVFWFTAAVSIGASMLAAFWPAVRASRRDPASALSERSATHGLARRRFIVIPQVALSLVALVAASLLIRSFDNTSAQNLGLERDGIVLSSFNPALAGYEEGAARELYRGLIARVSEIPSVTNASLASPLPLDAYQEGAEVFRPDADPERREEGIVLQLSIVHDDYFETVGTPLLEGRGFGETDTPDSRPVAVVNETLARTLAPNRGAVGGTFRLGRDGDLVEIVGVARNGKYLTLGEEPQPYLFLPLRQNFTSPVTLAVRSSSTPPRLEAELRSAMAALDPTLPLYGVKTMDQFIERSLAGPRALAVAVSLFAAVALSLSTLGVYGLMSYAVSQRRRELGIRMAIGADRGAIVRLFLSQAGRVVAPGLAVGLVLAWFASRALSSLLFGVSPTEPLIFATAALFIGGIALAGSYIPSRRASRLDPLTTLRHD